MTTATGTAEQPAGGRAERLVPISDRVAWSAALAGVPHGFAHTWSCCQAVLATHDYPTYLYVQECGTGRVLLPFAERGSAGAIDIVTPYGLSGFVASGTVPDFLEHWRRFCVARGYVCAYVAQHPTRGCELPAADTFVANTLFVMDLTLSLEELLARLSPSRRRELRKWEASGRVLVRDREVLSDFVVAQHAEVMRRIGARASAYFSAETLRRLCAAPEISLVGVEEHGRIVATHVYAQTPWDSELLFLLSLPEGRQYMPVLTWDVIMQCRTAGVPTLNLGGGLAPEDDIAHAKKRFSPGEFPLRSLRAVFDEEAYRRLCAGAGVSATARDGYFPPYRRELY